MEGAAAARLWIKRLSLLGLALFWALLQLLLCMRSIRVCLRVTKVRLLDWVRLYHAIYVSGVGA